MQETLIDRLQRFDDERPGIPGEHWAALGLGLWLLGRSGATPLARVASGLAGSALVYRALSGRDGVAKLWTNWSDRLGIGRAGRRPTARFMDIEGSMPYTKRVRVPAISQPIGRSM